MLPGIDQTNAHMFKVLSILSSEQELTTSSSCQQKDAGEQFTDSDRRHGQMVHLEWPPRPILAHQASA